MRAGIIDLGSNTTRLMVFEVHDDGTFRIVEGLKDLTKLESGITKSRRIDEPSIERALNSVSIFKEFCDALGVKKIMGVATAAVRSAVNGEELIEKIKRELALDIRIISGEEEGELDYYGVINTMDLRDGYILDMGGGSMELTGVREGELSSTKVIPYGAIDMSERLYSSYGSEVLEKDLRKRLSSVEKGADTLVGVGGTIRAIAKLDMKRKRYPIRILHNYSMNRKDVDKILKSLKGKNINEIIEKGVSASRAELIFPGAVALKTVMDVLGIEKLRISHSGIREGILYRDVLKVKGEPLDMSVKNMMSFYGVNVKHAESVENITLALFDSLKERHGGGEEERKLLSVAAKLHDIGLAIGYYDHGENGCSIVLNNGIYGLEHRDIVKCALIIKLHTDDGFKGYKGILSDKDKRDVINLSVLLRIAEAMDITESGFVRQVFCEIRDGALHLDLSSNLSTGTSPSPDQKVEGKRKKLWSYGIEKNGELFLKTYGLRLEIDC
ncbi:MAG: Ppx/GppA phosphatase family protein [Candidatus Thermoplasmatota archaeon]|nr:Ppx/GppA phosphatase family protein [Candidatus Thermoplasmatota archaeon]